MVYHSYRTTNTIINEKILVIKAYVCLLGHVYYRVLMKLNNIFIVRAQQSQHDVL